MIDHCNKHADFVTVNKNSRLIIPAQIVNDLFDDVVENIVNLVTETLKLSKLDDISTIFLVGGFSQCPLLQNQLRTKTSDEKPDVDLISPDEAILSVVKGAAMFGHNPMMIVSHIAPTTYLTMGHGDEPEIIIQKGDEINLGRCIPILVEPVSSEQSFIEMKLFSTSKDPPYRASDPDITRVCSVKINCGPNDRIQFEFTFGGTELKISAQNTTTGNRVDTTINYMN